MEDGTLLHARGDGCDGFYTIAHGAVRFSRTTADGHATTIAVMEAPNWFGEISIFDGMPQTHDAQCFRRIDFIVFCTAKLISKRLLTRYPVIYGTALAGMLALVRLRCHRRDPG